VSSFSFDHPINLNMASRLRKSKDSKFFPQKIQKHATDIVKSKLSNDALLLYHVGDEDDGNSTNSGLLKAYGVVKVRADAGAKSYSQSR
jgi:hypothetical protein